MADTVTLTAETRGGAGKGAARQTRRAGKVPAVIYGAKQSPLMIQMDPKQVVREARRRGFFARALNIKVDGKDHQVLPRDVQYDPVTDKPAHLDFMRVDAATKIRVQVPAEFVNEAESPGLKKGGVLNVVRREIECYCTLATIPEKLVVDLTGLEIGDSVHISKVKLPPGVTPTIRGRDFTIASVAVPSAAKAAAEEARAAAEAAAAAAAAGVVEAVAP
ncbi:MAG: 50S ribosomal protein L25/general stress protein Ctc, partial [Rhodospirillales bacterium]